MIDTTVTEPAEEPAMTNANYSLGPEASDMGKASRPHFGFHPRGPADHCYHPLEYPERPTRVWLPSDSKGSVVGPKEMSPLQ